jgi:hypothetical protein
MNSYTHVFAQAVLIVLISPLLYSVRSVIVTPGIQAMNTAMERYMTSDKVAIMYLQAIVSVCTHSNELRSTVGAQGVCEMTFRVVAAQPGHKYVLGYAMGPLRYLSQDNPANSVKLYDLGAVGLVAQVLADLDINDCCRVSGSAALQHIVPFAAEAGRITSEEDLLELQAMFAAIPRRDDRSDQPVAHEELYKS